MWALRHNAYKGGLDRWGMSAFISAIPLVLHAALFLFLVGLCLLLQPLDVYIAGLVVAITGTICLFYLAAGLAPLFWGDCPSATPGLHHLYTIWNDFVVLAVIRVFKILVVAVIWITRVLIAVLVVFSLIISFILRCCFHASPYALAPNLAGQKKSSICGCGSPPSCRGFHFG